MLYVERIYCVTYYATLANNSRVGLHFSESVPKATQTKDIAIEVGLMAGYLHVLSREAIMVQYMFFLK